jgi:predicted lipoprotein with Yx(FWY)xxD motif
MSLRRTIAAIVLTAGVVAACSVAGASPGGASSAPASPTAAASAAAGGVTIGISASMSVGTFLTGPNGMTLYTHAGDSATSSTCTGGCATAWPPLTIAAGMQPMMGMGMTGTMGTFMRTDGATQVTWQGMPLYYWQKDAKIGDVTGDGVNGFSVAKVGGGAPAPSAGAPAPSGAVPAPSANAPASPPPGNYGY